MRVIGLIVSALTLLSPADAWQHSRAISSPVPLFSAFPVRELYTGPPASLKFNSASDREYLQALLGRTENTPNFAGHYRIVQFRIGNGPTGAVIVDSANGSVHRLPREIATDDFFIHATDCLPAFHGLAWARGEDEEDASVPLSFKESSELLIVRQCRSDGPVSTVDRSYYRWHGGKWHLVARFASPPPPIP